ncbi:MAG: hypothetical protein KGI11_09295 [Thaumarchaeota archaeon]|nr:hypothetical protein [Nitrososphaerota archaeon]
MTEYSTVPYVPSTWSDWLKTPSSLAMNVDPKKSLEGLAVNQVFKNIYIDTLSNHAYQEPEDPLVGLYGIKSRQEEQYNKIQEELSELTRTNNQERKERLQLQVENNQLRKKLARTQAKLRACKSELNVVKGYEETKEQLVDLIEKVQKIDDEYNFRMENK